MKEICISTILILFSSIVLAQDVNQKWTLGKAYKTIVDFKVNYFEGVTIKQRTALAGLKYKYIETVDDKIFIKFLEITSDNTIAKGNDNYVNTENDDRTYFIIEDNIVDLNKQKTIRLVTGTLLAPIKIRPDKSVKGENIPWELSTDITLGQYLGFRFPVSQKNPFYITVPTITLGTSLLSINSSNTNPESESSTTLGLTWSTGIILDLNGFNIGFLWGKDYAPGTSGVNWIYNKENWFSIGFGINLTSKDRDL